MVIGGFDISGGQVFSPSKAVNNTIISNNILHGFPSQFGDNVVGRSDSSDMVTNN